MYYDRKIKYLDYYENGERLKGSGFVKLEAREDDLRLELTVKGLHPTDSFVRDVVLSDKTQERVLGQISIQSGSGAFTYVGRLGGEHNEEALSYGELREIRIPIGGTREIRCLLKQPVRRAEVPGPERYRPANAVAVEDTESKSVSFKKAEPEKKESESVRSESVETENARAGSVQPEETEPLSTDIEDLEDKFKLVSSDIIMLDKEEVEDIRTEKKQAEDEAAKEQKITQADEEHRCKDKTPRESDRERHGTAKAQARPQVKPGGKRPVKLRDDKWQQLCAIYPHIQPFKDERDYLSISPADFVLFPSKYYQAVNNSFLLHGYYNYDHLILARLEHRGEAQYYLGVPGNYYDREKQVAVMFGFESFECASETASTGDFGYYMMRTEL